MSSCKYTTSKKRSTQPIIILEVNVDNDCVCDFCLVCFSSHSNLTRHQLICPKKKEYVTILEHKIELYKQTIEYKDQTIEQKDQIIKKIVVEKEQIVVEKDTRIQKIEQQAEQAAKFYQDIIINAGSVLQTSMSTLAFVMKEYKNAPECKSIEDYTIMYMGSSEDEFVDNLIYSYNNNILHKYIGNALVSIYKKDDPAMQTLWNSDTTRLTYIVSHFLNETTMWKIDKNGVDIGAIIIRPLLEYISDLVVAEIQTITPNRKMRPMEIKELMDRSKTLNLIKKSIDTMALDLEILKYIAPHFNVSTSAKQIKQIKELRDPKKIIEFSNAEKIKNKEEKIKNKAEKPPKMKKVKQIKH
jgi:hypothetical protein